MAATIKFSGIPCIMPSEEVQRILSERRDGARPNCFVTRWGVDPGYGWLLLTQGDVDSLDLTATTHSLVFEGPDDTVTIANLTVVSTESVYFVPGADSNDLVLVRVEDRRTFGRMTHVAEGYALRRRSETLDTGSQYYQTAADGNFDPDDIVSDIWTNSMPAIMGTLSTDIHSTYYTNQAVRAEDLNYHGWSAWEAACDAAMRGGLAITWKASGSPILFAPYNLNSGTTASQLTNLEPYLFRSSRPKRTDVSVFPEKFEVHFRKVFGDHTDETDTKVVTNREANYVDPFYVKEITTSTVNSDVSTVTGTKMVLYGDRVMTDDPSTSGSTFDAEATDIVERYILANTQQTMNLFNIYSGILDVPFYAFEEVAFWDHGEGLFTAVRCNPVAWKPDHRNWNKDYAYDLLGFGQATATASEYNYSSSAATSTTVKPVLPKASTDATSSKSFTGYNYGMEIISGGNVLFIKDRSTRYPVVLPIGWTGYRPFVMFTLTAALSTSDSSTTSATLSFQYGPGKNNSNTPTLLNVAASSGYIFSGANGARGIAAWSTGNQYVILNMECP